MNDNQDPRLAAHRRLGRSIAGVVFAALAGLLAFQMLGEPLVALGAALGAGGFAFAIWGGFVVRPEGVSYGRAAGVGMMATVAAFLVAALTGGAASRVVVGAEAAGAAFFAFLVVLPVMIAAGVGLVALMRAKFAA